MVYTGQAYSSPSEALAHYGKKGMRWGVINDEEATGDTNALTNVYQAAAAKLKPLTPAESSERFKKINENFYKKADRSEADSDPKEGLTPGQKKALYIGAGALTLAAVAGGAYAYKRYGNQALPDAARLYEQQRRDVDAAIFASGHHIHPSSFNRPGFTLKAGHTFQRVSTAAEKSFESTTYTSHTPGDYNRYLGEGFGRLIESQPLYRISFTAKEDIKVPHITSVLETLREVAASEGQVMSHEDSIKAYGTMIGSDFYQGRGLKLVDALAKKGFGALYDEADGGRVGESPIVIFAKEKLTEKIATTLTPKDVLRAQRLMEPMKNAKL